MRTAERVGLKHIGCKVNQYEIWAIAGKLEDSGFKVVSDPPYDIFIVNGCAVTHVAERKTRHAIKKVRRENPNSFIVVTGCFAEKCKEEALITGADLVVLQDEKANIVSHVVARRRGIVGRGVFSSDGYPEMRCRLPQERVRAYLKVQDGCDQYCAYCIIPYLRGRPRSRELKDAVREAEHLIAAGAKELVLVGIHIGKWGIERGEKLEDLVERILEIPGEWRLRLTSIEVTEITDRLIELLLHPKFAKHLHIPLQSGSNRVLTSMGRPYTAELFLKKVEEVRERVGDLAITTDVIVGFPTETEEDFERTVRVVEKVGFSRLHVFPFSPRPMTRAYGMGDPVPYEEKKRRTKYLIGVGEKLREKFAEKHVGKRLRVLVEAVKKGKPYGLSDNYIPTYLDGGEVGELLDVLVVRNVGGEVEGRVGA